MSVTAVPIRPIKRGSVPKFWIALGALCLAGGAVAWAGTSHQQLVTTQSGLRYQVITPGEGPLLTPADLVLLHYEGRLEDGTVFDSSEARGQPMATAVTGLIPGFSEGLQLMRKGSEYRLFIPSHLAYGSQPPQGSPIPPNANLVFRIRVVDVAPGMAGMQQMMGPGGGRGAPGGAEGIPEGMIPEGMGPPPGAGPERGAPGGEPAQPAPGRRR